MSNPLRTSGDYELFLYTLTDQFPLVRERLVYRSLPVVIDWYGYEVWRGNKKLYWYDSQPHPSDPAPHHKHIHPGIKHHRIPAPEMSFTKPNLPALIHEIEALI